MNVSQTMHEFDDYSGVRVLLTGAGGFIGSHLCEALCRAGAEVRALVRYNSRSDQGLLAQLPADVLAQVEVVSGDVRDAGQMASMAADREVIFHLAALIGIPYSYEAPESYVDTNVRGTLNVLEAGKAAGVGRIVLTSTSEVYGTALHTPMGEDHPLQAQSPYSASKIAADKLGESYHLSFELPVAVLRPFNTYGPRQSARAIIPTIVSQLVAGCDVLKIGSVEPVRDFCFVADTVRGFLRAGRAPGAVGQVTNVGTGVGVSIGALAETAMQALGRQVPIETDASRVRPARSEVMELVAGVERARDVLQWTPEVALAEGLTAVIEHVTAHQGDYATSTYAV